MCEWGHAKAVLCVSDGVYIWKVWERRAPRHVHGLCGVHPHTDSVEAHAVTLPKPGHTHHVAEPEHGHVGLFDMNAPGRMC